MNSPNIKPTYESGLEILVEFNTSNYINALTEADLKLDDRGVGYYSYDNKDASAGAKLRDFFRKIVNWFRKVIQVLQENYSSAERFIKKYRQAIEEYMRKIPKDFVMKIHFLLLPDTLKSGFREEFHIRDVLLDSLTSGIYDIQSIDDADSEKIMTIHADTRIEAHPDSNTISLAQLMLSSYYRKLINAFKNAAKSYESLSNEYIKAKIPKTEDGTDPAVEALRTSRLYMKGYSIFMAAYRSALEILKTTVSGFKSNQAGATAEAQ